MSLLLLLIAPSGFPACEGNPDTPSTAPAAAGRGFPAAAPWVSFYGPASAMGDPHKVADMFRIVNIDADPESDSDPDGGNFTRAQIVALKKGGANRVISYLDIGSCESWRSYWKTTPRGFAPAKSFAIGPYSGYPDEQWMKLGDPGYQDLIVGYVAARLAAKGVDGFYLDNLELVEHGPRDSNGPCDSACRQGGLDIVRKLREKYPNLLLVMQNATSDITRRGMTGGIAFPSLLDGIAHEEVYAPTYDATAEAELRVWRGLGLKPGALSGSARKITSAAHQTPKKHAPSTTGAARRVSPLTRAMPAAASKRFSTGRFSSRLGFAGRSCRPASAET